MELKWIKKRILLSFLGVQKIQTHRYFLTNQIRIISYLFWSQNIFLLISFWAEFYRMLLFCVFSWYVGKYKNVTSMLMRFWSEFSKMFLSVVFWLFIFRLKICILYHFSNRWNVYYSLARGKPFCSQSFCRNWTLDVTVYFHVWYLGRVGVISMRVESGITLRST